MDTSFITVNFNSSVKIRTDDGRIIYVDPYKIEGSPADADLIFLTHDHYDHFSPADIKKIRKPETAFVYPKRMSGVIQRLFSPSTVIPVLPGNSYEQDGLSFETVASYNIWKYFHPKFVHNCGYIISVNRSRIYISGDMDVTKEALAVKCDIAIIPVGGFYTMNYEKAAGYINTIKPAAAIPTHYGKVAGKPSNGKDFAGMVNKDIQVDIKLP